ncbi:hypothetical protein BD311DRAFT_777841 [Dichomitus squalens]|uniref:F-box domain-containing protein n=1 Tax=Dichomitus squalens TaxID=114155 RepID=A0A4Q9MN11_9APHY|nr:hypothetical protein BD311DRAFT_777841 [Dichomitus squalens]
MAADNRTSNSLAYATARVSYPTNLASAEDIRKFLQNAFSPVNRLPNELLGQVFYYLKGPGGENGDLIDATHVCRHWRAVATNDSNLWSSFALHSSLGVEECLARSRNLPISLSLVKPPDPASAKLLEQATHRVRNLYVAIPEARAIEVLLSTIRNTAPLLEELHVKHLHWSPLDEPQRKRGRPVRIGEPPLLYSERADFPSLRSLVLHDVPPFFLPTASLEHLELHMNAKSGPGFTRSHSLPPLSRLLDILKNCPRLRELDLAGQCDMTNTIVAREQPVTLANLSSMSLMVQPATATASILSHLALPQTVNLHIKSNLLLGEFFGDVMSTLTPLSPALHWTEGLRRLQLTWGTYPYRLEAHRDPNDFACPPALDCHVRCRNLLADLGNDLGHVSSFLNGWTTAINTSNVEELVLSYDAAHGAFEVPYQLPVAQWSSLLRALPNLKSLRVIGLETPSAATLMQALGRVGTEVHCPKLETLEWMYVKIDAWRDLWDIAVARSAGEQSTETFKKLELFSCSGLQLRGTEWERLFNVLGVELGVDED